MRNTKTGDTVYFVVAGKSQFPYDMLRYDSCRPASETDSPKLQDDVFARVPRFVVMAKTLTQPLREYRTIVTSGRWRSFGWMVLGEVPMDSDCDRPTVLTMHDGLHDTEAEARCAGKRQFDYRFHGSNA